MKKRLNVIIYRNGELNANVLRIVSNYNEGLINPDLGEIKQGLMGRAYEFPHLLKGTEIIEYPGSLTILQDGQPTIRIENVEVYELSAQTTANDLENVNF